MSGLGAGFDLHCTPTAHREEHEGAHRVILAQVFSLTLQRPPHESSHVRVTHKGSHPSRQCLRQSLQPIQTRWQPSNDVVCINIARRDVAQTLPRTIVVLWTWRHENVRRAECHHRRNFLSQVLQFQCCQDRVSSTERVAAENQLQFTFNFFPHGLHTLRCQSCHVVPALVQSRPGASVYSHTVGSMVEGKGAHVDHAVDKLACSPEGHVQRVSRKYRSPLHHPAILGKVRLPVFDWCTENWYSQIRVVDPQGELSTILSAAVIMARAVPIDRESAQWTRRCHVDGTGESNAL
mmetsp:Transcript_4043/g.11336  ORF Transcript_4043/g.11336 Transcript_4043/m.11336 type:complete len:293 (-) Transcript_4043:1823-2701(-)